MQDTLKHQKNEFTTSDITLNRQERVVQISRRIDWRFLLPVPDFGDVALIGSGDDELIAALRQFSSSLEIVAPVHSGDFVENNQNRFDIVVFNNVDCSIVNLSNVILKSGGWLYWEINRKRVSNKQSDNAFRLRRDRNRSSTVVSLSRYTHVERFKDYLESLDFREVEIHWHRPDFVNSKELIPLEVPEALRYVFSRGQSGLRGQMKLFGGRMLYRSGLLPFIVPCFSLIARKK